MPRLQKLPNGLKNTESSSCNGEKGHTMSVALFKIFALGVFYSAFFTYKETKKLSCQKSLQAISVLHTTVFQVQTTLVLTKWSFAVATLL